MGQITEWMLDSGTYSDYLSYETLQAYFRELYQQSKEKLDYPVQSETILDLLSLNKKHFEMLDLPIEQKRNMQFSVQAFRTAGSLFEVIDSRTQDILVPFNEEAKSYIAALNEALPPERCHELLRWAQKYTVSVYNLKKLDEIGAVYRLASGVIALDARFYDKDCGIVTEGAEQEVLIF